MSTTLHLIQAAAQHDDPMRTVGFVGARIASISLAIWGIVRWARKAGHPSPPAQGHPPVAPPPVWHPHYGWIAPPAPPYYGHPPLAPPTDQSASTPAPWPPRVPPAAPATSAPNPWGGASPNPTTHRWRK